MLGPFRELPQATEYGTRAGNARHRPVCDGLRRLAGLPVALPVRGGGAMSPRIEWGVRYRRAKNTDAAIRKYETKPGALAFIEALLAAQHKFGELAEVQLLHREVGPWQAAPNEVAR